MWECGSGLGEVRMLGVLLERWMNSNLGFFMGEIVWGIDPFDWIPDVPVEETPTVGDVFNNFDEAYNMYLEYSQKARFSIRKSTTKRKNAHRLRVAFMGGYHKVRVKAIDWKNFRSSLNKYIGPEDAQMLVDKVNDRKKHVPSFSFEYKTVNDELSRMFWADEAMKCNYIAFGDVVSFYATYRTNRDRWISGYFKDLPMCCLMKTTSRSESSNAFFWIHSHQ
nr:protein FAR1-related sequence 5-like [Tanacetum cinerariifolium]